MGKLLLFLHAYFTSYFYYWSSFIELIFAMACGEYKRGTRKKNVTNTMNIIYSFKQESVYQLLLNSYYNLFSVLGASNTEIKDIVLMVYHKKYYK